MRRPRLVAAIVAGFALATIAVSAAVEPSALPSANVSAYDVRGHKLPGDPTVVNGETLVIIATGFAALQRVTLQRPGYPSSTPLADLQGTVRFVYVVPRSLPNGDFAVSIVAVASPVHTSGTPPPPTTAGTEDPQAAQARVPVFGVFPFVKNDPGSSSSASVSGTATSRGGGDGGQSGVAVSATTIYAGGPPAHTGADILEPLIAGIVGVGAGVAIAVAARRRNKGEPAA